MIRKRDNHIVQQTFHDFEYRVHNQINGHTNNIPSPGLGISSAAVVGERDMRGDFCC